MNKMAPSKILKTKDKRADIPITILILGVVALCIFAIINFTISSGKIILNSIREGIMVELIENLNSDIERFHFYLNAGISEEEAARRVGGIIESGFLIIERKPSWETARDKDQALVIYREKLN